jgi:hypothetical protein
MRQATTFDSLTALKEPRPRAASSVVTARSRSRNAGRPATNDPGTGDIRCDVGSRWRHVRRAHFAISPQKAPSRATTGYITLRAPDARSFRHPRVSMIRSLGSIVRRAHALSATPGSAGTLTHCSSTIIAARSWISSLRVRQSHRSDRRMEHPCARSADVAQFPLNQGRKSSSKSPGADMSAVISASPAIDLAPSRLVNKLPGRRAATPWLAQPCNRRRESLRAPACAPAHSARRRRQRKCHAGSGTPLVRRDVHRLRRLATRVGGAPGRRPVHSRDRRKNRGLRRSTW